MGVSTKVFCYIIIIITIVSKASPHFSNLPGQDFPKKYPAPPKFPPCPLILLGPGSYIFLQNFRTTITEKYSSRRKTVIFKSPLT